MSIYFLSGEHLWEHWQMIKQLTRKLVDALVKISTTCNKVDLPLFLVFREGIIFCWSRFITLTHHKIEHLLMGRIEVHVIENLFEEHVQVCAGVSHDEL